MSFQDYQGGQGPYYQPPPPTSGAATAALVLGILGLLVCPLICSPLALVYGHRARREIDGSGGRMGGRGQATAGIITGWVGLALLVIAIILGAALIVIGASVDSTTTY